jgi:hypothetical protein
MKAGQRHRQMYPTQYVHPMCGKAVSLRPPGNAAFVIERVIVTRFGPLAIPVRSSLSGTSLADGYPLAKCVETSHLAESIAPQSSSS